MSKITHYFKRRKAMRLFADRFLFEPQVPQVQPGMVVNPPQQPMTQFKPELPQQPLPPPNQVQVQPAPQGAPAQPTQIPVQQATSTRDEIDHILQPVNRAKMDVINRRLT